MDIVSGSLLLLFLFVRFWGRGDQLIDLTGWILFRDIWIGGGFDGNRDIVTFGVSEKNGIVFLKNDV